MSPPFRLLTYWFVHNYANPMQVNLKYAEEHFADLASAADAGEEVEISRPNLPSLKLVVSNDRPAQSRKSRAGLIGSGKGKFVLSPEWDSPETNAEIEALFNESKLFPNEA